MVENWLTTFQFPKYFSYNAILNPISLFDPLVDNSNIKYEM